MTHIPVTQIKNINLIIHQSVYVNVCHYEQCLYVVLRFSKIQYLDGPLDPFGNALVSISMLKSKHNSEIGNFLKTKIVTGLTTDREMYT